ncbi:MAG: HipA domain-containing protein [Eggerthellaceae bacterium]|nr:HipA domain-containing protein [Eggerthellaceae bacterium]
MSEATGSRSEMSRLGEEAGADKRREASGRKAAPKPEATRVAVWREVRGSFERIGSIGSERGRARFRYDSAYGGEPISVRLPVRPEPFTLDETAAFFAALTPEGKVGDDFLELLRAEKGEYLPVLAELRDESVGALLLSVGDDNVGQDPAYAEVPDGFFDDFSAHPTAVALDTAGKTRLSLPGAMAKVGLYRDPVSRKWFLPHGSAPSNRIVKACNADLYPNETVNEALCLEAARLVGLPAAECELLPTDGQPLLSVTRFDRVTLEGCMVAGRPAYGRLHQEDMMQASGLPDRYAPSEANYLSVITHLVNRASVNAFGDVMLAIEYTMFDYLVGNCDKHLKNSALLHVPDWNTIELAPLYDVVNTTLYPHVYLEMGVPLCPSRRIADVTRGTMRDVVSACVKNPDLAMRAFDDLARRVPGALEEARDLIAARGFDSVRAVFDAAIGGVCRRASI